MKQQLLTYLNKPTSFKTGISLFQHFYPNNNLLKMLNKGFTISGEQRMIALLTKIVEKKVYDYPKEIIVPVVDVESAPVEYSLLSDSKSHDILTELKKEKSKLWAQSSAAHLELARIKLSSKECEIRSKLIIENFKRIDEIWRTIDYYEQYGKLPNKYKYASDYEQGLINSKRIGNLRTYISKLKRELPLVKSSKKKIEKTEKLNQYTFELNQLQHGA